MQTEKRRVIVRKEIVTRFTKLGEVRKLKMIMGRVYRYKNYSFKKGASLISIHKDGTYDRTLVSTKKALIDVLKTI